MWRQWGLSSLWVAIGATCLGALRVMRVDFGSAWLPLYIVGMGFVTAGPWQLLVGIQRAVKVERILSVHEEGVRWEDGAVVAHLRWAELEGVDVEADHIALRGETTRVVVPHQLDGIDPSSLAAMLMDMRRKALMGLPVRLSHIPDRT